MQFRKTLIALGLMAAAGLSMAQTQTPDPQPTGATAAKMPMSQAREKHQNKRIERGVEQGDLTKREARRLKLEQKAVDYRQQKAEADGVVTPEERARINRLQDRTSKDIKRQRSDAATRPVPAPVPQQ
jgi:hypothetical protein